MNEMFPPQLEPDAGLSTASAVGLTPAASSRGRHRNTLLVPSIVAFTLLAATAAGFFGWRHFGAGSARALGAAPQAPDVTVATPLQETVAPTTSFLGQFSAVDSADLRAQVGGTLAQIAFRDGQIVHKGDPLFTIDPRPYQIRLEQAAAQLQVALSRKALADAELWRAPACCMDPGIARSRPNPVWDQAVRT